VKIRASQINGCSSCTDMHTEDATHAGESQVRQPADDYQPGQWA